MIQVIDYMKKDINKTYPIKRLLSEEFPVTLAEIPQPPKKLSFRGVMPDSTLTYLTVVGSRHYSPYGEHVTHTLIAGLRGYPVVIVSGLAMGIDTIAHQTALSNNIPTISFPGSGLDWDVLSPSENRNLAEQILESGGALISEFNDTQNGAPWTFPQRNRLMAGLARATLLIECTEKSGTLITARLALDYNRDLLVVPGSIFGESSTGSNKLLRQGAVPITCVEDLIEALGFSQSENPSAKTAELANCSPNERAVLELLRNNSLSRDDIINSMELSVAETNSILSIMEIKGLIIERFGEMWRN